MKSLALVLACLPACFAQQAQLNFGDTITGGLTGDDGTVIVGGYISLLLNSPYPSLRPQQTEWAATSGVDGSFRFDGLNDGAYTLCVQVAGAWLNPCNWGQQPPVVTLSTAQVAATIAISLKKGVVVPIRVDDPTKSLSQNEGTTPGAQLLMGVGHDPYIFDRAILASQDATGRNYSVVIPYGYSAKLVVVSSFFRLSDVTGTALPTTATTIPILVPAGQQAPTIRLIVTGGGAQ